MDKSCDCKTPFFRRILILRFPYVENLLHFNLADFPVNLIKQFVSCFFYIVEISIVLLFTLHITKNIAYHITEVLIFYADKLTVMGNSKNLCVFNFAILLRSRKSQKFDAHNIYMFYGM